MFEPRGAGLTLPNQVGVPRGRSCGWLLIDFGYILILQAFTCEKLNLCYLRSVLVLPDHISLASFFPPHFEKLQTDKYRNEY